MATTGSFTIGGTTPDYATIQAWADAPTGNLTGIFEGKVRAGSYVENVAIDHAWTTTSSFYMKLGPDTGAHHGGRPGAGVDVHGGTTLNDHIFTISVDFTRVKGINAGKMLGQSSESFRIAADGVYIEECIGQGGTTYDSDFCNLVCPDTSTVRIANNLVIGMARAAVIIQSTFSSGLTLYCYNNTAIYCGLTENGDDLTGFGSEGTAASARTLVLKNNYCHATNTNRTVTCYAKVAADSWGASVDNASSDATAPGTSALTSVALTSFQQPPINETIGENTGDDYSGTTEGCTLNKDLATTNKTDALVLRHDGTETPDQVKSVLYRCDMTNFPAATKVYFAGVQFELAAADNGPAGTVFLSNRNWVEAEATWNIYSTGNSWGSVGSLGSADLLAGSNGNLIADPDSGSYAGEAYRTGTVTASDKWTFSCQQLNQWAEAAIQGTGGSPKGVNWLDLVLHRDGGGANLDFTMDSPEDADGNKPFVQVIYETASTILDLHPTSASVLDGVGTDLSADGNFPITTDLSGDTRIDSTWEIGAFQLLSEGVFTIGGTNPDYATPQAWADSPQANLTGIYEGKMRAGTYDRVDIDHAYTTGATAYMLLTYDAAGDYHAGVFGDGAIISGVNSTPDTNNIQIVKDYTRIVGITSTRPLGKSAEAIHIKGDEVRIERNLIYDGGNYQSDGIYFAMTSANSTVYVSNNFVGYFARIGIFSQNTANDGLTARIYNNTIIYCGGSIAGSANAMGSIETGGVAPTTARTFHCKNNYIATRVGDTWTHTCFKKDAGDSWGTSTNNASSDATAPGTSPQTSAALGSQFTNPFINETMGENTADDISATSEGCRMARGNPTSNDATELVFEFNGDTPPQKQSSLLRFNLVNATAPKNLVGGLINLKGATGVGSTNNQGQFFLTNRNWVEAQATWNIFSTSNNWGTAGCLNTSDVIEGGDGDDDPGTADTRAWNWISIANNDRVRLGTSRLTAWIEDAIAGTAGAPKGGDWLDMVAHLYNTTWNDPEPFNSPSDADTELPFVEVWYDTVASPADYRPIGTGVLDDNGTDLSADTYVVNTDITGVTRDGTWDIGAWTAGVVESAAAAVTLALTVATVKEVVDHSAAGAGTLAITVAAPAVADHVAAASESLVITINAPAAMEFGAAGAETLTITTTSGGQPVDYQVPISDISTGTWENEVAGTTNLYLSIDEGEPGVTSDYMISTSLPDTVEVRLAAVGDPASSVYHVIQYSAERTDALSLDLTLSLVENTTVLDTWTDTIPQAETLFQRVLSGAVTDSITDYTNLRLRMTASVT